MSAASRFDELLGRAVSMRALALMRVLVGPVVLLHSAAAARHLAELCTQDGIDRATIALACLGPRIAEAAGAGWREVGVASRPDDAALLALAARMCQSAAVRVDDNNTIG